MRTVLAALSTLLLVPACRDSSAFLDPAGSTANPDVPASSTDAAPSDAARAIRLVCADREFDLDDAEERLRGTLSHERVEVIAEGYVVAADVELVGTTWEERPEAPATRYTLAVAASWKQLLPARVDFYSIGGGSSWVENSLHPDVGDYVLVALTTSALIRDPQCQVPMNGELGSLHIPDGSPDEVRSALLCRLRAFLDETFPAY